MRAEGGHFEHLLPFMVEALNILSSSALIPAGRTSRNVSASELGLSAATSDQPTQSQNNEKNPHTKHIFCRRVIFVREKCESYIVTPGIPLSLSGNINIIVHSLQKFIIMRQNITLDVVKCVGRGGHTQAILLLQNCKRVTVQSSMYVVFTSFITTHTPF